VPRRPQESVALRLLAALAGIGILEVTRYVTFRSAYEADPSLWLSIGGSVAFNLWFQWWTLPDTALTSLIAAVLAEAGLPPTARIVANAIVALGRGLAPLLAPH
jgi:hypothetical protein